MIISASRRTDIPAFYSEWFMNRVRAGFCHFVNPFNADQIVRVSLKPEEVDAIVFWSKNPALMLPHVDELERMGFRFYFQFTLNDYPKELEPGVPPLKERIGTFRKLSDVIGRKRVIFRYDPIIISNRTSYDYHRERFERLCGQLKGATERVVISIIDYYKKTQRRLEKLDGFEFDFSDDLIYSPQMEHLLRDMASIAQKGGLEIQSCAEARDFKDFGISHGSCIDGSLIERIWPSVGKMAGVGGQTSLLPEPRKEWKRDKHQRPDCRCAVSKDIGMLDTCLHDCPYCYSTQSLDAVLKKRANYDPRSTALIGSPEIESDE
ncbi:MAG: DUF1848 domain-containing protein [Candidatus Coatesbacteria bacterium]|nr:DUF1848 domain-containing protein [Candidatus Coatesbacteria bacterium]